MIPDTRLLLYPESIIEYLLCHSSFNPTFNQARYSWIAKNLATLYKYFVCTKEKKSKSQTVLVFFIQPKYRRLITKNVSSKFYEREKFKKNYFAFIWQLLQPKMQIEWNGLWKRR